MDRDGTQRLVREKVLSQLPFPTHLDHPDYGRVDVRRFGGRFFLIDAENPSRNWVEVEEGEVQSVGFSHHGMASWLARCCGVEGESVMRGDVWTIGTPLVQGQRCRLLYYAGPMTKDSFLSRMWEIDSDSVQVPQILVVPFGIPLAREDLNQLERRSVSVNYLYSLLSLTGFDLERFELPKGQGSRKPRHYFRRADKGNNWEIGFNTERPAVIPGSVAIDRIWLLLRNPKKEFLASDITDELNGVSTDKRKNDRDMDSNGALVRSKGTTSRSIKDLTPFQQQEARALLAELARARREDGETSVMFREAEEASREFFKRFSLPDSFGGRAKRESDDAAKEAASIKKSIDRWIKEQRAAGRDRLAEHLGASIKRGSIFCYDPESLPHWET